MTVSVYLDLYSNASLIQVAILKRWFLTDNVTYTHTHTTHVCMPNVRMFEHLGLSTNVQINRQLTGSPDEKGRCVWFDTPTP